VEIASRVEELARRVLDQSRRQKALTESANREAVTGEASACATSTARRSTRRSAPDQLIGTAGPSPAA
jgi:hypothetical protein